MTNKEWLDYLAHNAPDELAAWFDAERITNQAEMLHMPESHESANPDCSAMLYKTFTGNMCSHYEPKDGVVAILREAARNLSDYHDAGEALRRLTDTTNVYHALETLADMVERDYVRRESIEEVMDNDRALVEENSMLAGELLKLRAELERATNNLNSANKDFENARAELTAESDELKAEIAKYEHDCGLLFDEKHKLTADAKRWADAANSQRLVAMEQADKVQELTAERDELKELNEYHALQYELASEDADRLQAQVDGLQSKLAEYEDRSMQYVSLTGGKFYTGTKALTERIAELTAELDAAKQQISQFDAPKSVETSENPASKCEIRDFDDSREQLEADVRKHYSHTTSTLMYPPSANKQTDWLASMPMDTVFGWLDRQAAITQHEITERWAEHLHPIERKCGDLRRKVDELEADNDRLANLLSKSLEEYSKLEAERDNLEANNQQLHTLAGEQAATIDELQKQVDELTNAGRKMSTELANMQDYITKVRAGREHYRSMCSEMATKIHDALMVMDEGMA